MINESGMKSIARDLARLPALKAQAEEAMQAKAALRARRSFSSARDESGRPRTRRPVVPDAEWARIAYFRARFGLSRYQMESMSRNGDVAVKVIGERRFWRIADVERVFADPAPDMES